MPIAAKARPTTEKLPNSADWKRERAVSAETFWASGKVSTGRRGSRDWTSARTMGARAAGAAVEWIKT